LAHATHLAGGTIPKFMEPVTNLAGVSDLIRRWQRGREVEEWQQRLQKLPAEDEATAATTPTDLAVANAERSAAAARVAIPSAEDRVDLTAIAQSSIQALQRVSEVAGQGAHANALREHLRLSAALVRRAAEEAEAAARASEA
jgi:hypothetical protein